MDRRLQLHQILKAVPGIAKAYYQPPENVKLEYPCIVYTDDDEEPEYADNVPYRLTTKYQVTVIDRNPDSSIPKAIARMPTSRRSRRFVTDNLYHTVYNLFF